MDVFVLCARCGAYYYRNIYELLHVRIRTNISQHWNRKKPDRYDDDQARQPDDGYATIKTHISAPNVADIAHTQTHTRTRERATVEHTHANGTRHTLDSGSVVDSTIPSGTFRRYETSDIAHYAAGGACCTYTQLRGGCPSPKRLTTRSVRFRSFPSSYTFSFLCTLRPQRNAVLTHVDASEDTDSLGRCARSANSRPAPRCVE